MNALIQVSPTRRIRIKQDMDPLNPRKDFEPLTVMVGCRNRHVSFDKTVSSSLEAIAAELKFRAQRPKESDEAYANAVRKAMKGVLRIKTIYAYVHSGIALAHSPFSCSWDSGPAGTHMVRLDVIRKNWPDLKTEAEIEAKADKVMAAELEAYQDYLDGNCWWFGIENAVLGGWEIEDSCGGFLGDIEDCGIRDHLSGEDREAFDAEYPERKQQKGA